jgi:hypothetical protein
VHGKSNVKNVKNLGSDFCDGRDGVFESLKSFFSLPEIFGPIETKRKC